MPTGREHRRDLAELTRKAESDLRLAMRGFDTADAARDGLRDILPRLVRIYGAAAASLAADWYDERRESLGVSGRFTAIPAEYVANSGRTDSLARWAVTPLYQAEPDFTLATSLVIGGAQRIIGDASRETVLGSIRQDRQAGRVESRDRR